MASIEDKLRKKLYRAFCPDSMELDDYLLGLLIRERAASIGEHLKECPYCRNELAQMRAFREATGPDLERTLLDRIRILVARLVRAAGSGSAGLTLAPQGVRGNEAHALTYETEGMQVVLDIQPDPQRSDLRAIYGLLIGSDPAQQFQARLIGMDGPAVTAPVDEFGNFTFLQTVPGQRELTLLGPSVEIHIEELVIE